MISVLIVEDDAQKLGHIKNVLQANSASNRIDHALSAADAFEQLQEAKYDLLILDINIPLRLGEAPRRRGGVQLLHDLSRSNPKFLPRYIVGVTAYEDIVAEFGEEFTDQLWTLIHYQQNSDRWIAQIGAKVAYIQAAKASEQFTDGVTYGVDLAIICALDEVEFTAIKSLPFTWQPLRLPHDETRYLSGSVVGADKREFSVIAAAAPRMGMSASAVLASKIIAQFRPRVLSMVGICAGRSEKTNLGDVIIGDPCWDWGSGKIDSVRNRPVFRPAPHQVELDTDMTGILKEACSDVKVLAGIKERARGRKPDTELKVHFGPLASGASVVANKKIFESLLDQHRNLLGIEMEAYGVVIACKGSGKPRPTPVIMKSVCDFADRDKDDDYQEYAAHTSALLLHHCAREFLAIKQK